MESYVEGIRHLWKLVFEKLSSHLFILSLSTQAPLCTHLSMRIGIRSVCYRPEAYIGRYKAEES